MSPRPQRLPRIEAYPMDFPMTGIETPSALALLVIDMQVDFVGPGGYMDRMGADLDALRAPIEPLSRVLAAARARAMPVIHTRETFAPDLSDVQPHRRFRGADGETIVVGDEGPLGRCLVRGEPCWAIIEELSPLPGEAVFDKCGYGAFGTTALHAHLQSAGVRALILTGVTTNCCVHSTLREALDRGYECLVLEDCCGAGSRESHERAIAMMRSPDAVFGALGTAAAALSALAG